MGLFDKKYCDICGEKIHLLGNRKLDDGNMCSSCAKLMSPFMEDRRHTTVSEMKQHLAYREENKKKLASFFASETYGYGVKIYIDRRNNCFVSSFSNPNAWEKTNPDIIPLNEIVSCNLDIRENMQEEFWEDQEGEERSYSPPRYIYDYDFYIKIHLSNKWFQNIDIKLNSSDVEGRNSQEFFNYQNAGQQIVNALTGGRMNGSAGNAGMGNQMNGYDRNVGMGNQMNGCGGNAGMGNQMYGYGGNAGMGNQMNAYSGNNPTGNNMNGFDRRNVADNGVMMGVAAGTVQNFSGGFSQNANGNQYQQVNMAENQQQSYNSNQGMMAGNQSFAQNQNVNGFYASQMRCPNCGQITDGRFCPNCGTQTVAMAVNKIRCSACGQEIETNGGIPKFCPACGSKI